METKVCSKCKIDKSVDQFYVKSKSSDGIDYYCKSCRNKANAKVHETTSRVCSIDGCDRSYYTKGYCRRHYARVLRTGGTDRTNKIYDKERVYITSDGYSYALEYIKRYNLKYTYNLSLEKYNEMIEDGCYVCKGKGDITLHVDHDHNCCSGSRSCGDCVRGILCHRCNVAVDKYEQGILRDNYPLLNEIATYLKVYGKL